MPNGGEIIVEYLAREKVPYVFGLCGHGNVGLLDALYDRTDAIKTISTRHEQTAGHMADAYFRVAHRPVATLTSCGPGSANLPIALACAFMDSSALLAITANIPTSQFNRAAFQETYRHFQADFPSVIRPYVKRSWQPTRTDMLPTALRQAFATMLGGRPGPVNLDVPFNVFKEPAEVDVPEPGAWRAGISSRSGGDPGAIQRVAELLRKARRPLIYVGHGVTLSEAGDELTAFARRERIPVIFSPNGFGSLDMTDPLALGFVGRNGVYGANEAARTCDVLLALGVRFDDRSSSSWIPGYSFNIPPTRLIHVDIDGEEIGRNYPVHLGIVGDVRTVLRQLLAATEAPGPEAVARDAWLADIAKWRAQWEEFVRPHETSEAEPIHPQRVVQALRAVMPDDGIILPDVGVHHNWVVQFWRARRPQTLLNSWGFGAMGFGVCGVLGAKLAAPDRPCVTVCGDGGFMMRPDVLCTAVEYDIPAVWVVWNNFAYGGIRDIQLGMFAKREIATSFVREKDGRLVNPDFVALARACGADGIRVERPRDLAGAIEHAIKAHAPFVLDVHVDRDIRPPGVGTWELPPLPYGEPAFGKRRLPREGE
ncbi:MAG TPA: thiamine pyrophosphate-binding protein [Candidatus Deferrimicrobiaceae bacterium]|nr:thiamine pyrophosphate-binding protein [Candidatus Deferrimicrobiaceae bacterium]